MLEFIVNEQLLQRADKNSPATDSIDYLKAKFTFKTSDWDGAEKKAIFTSHNGTYDAVLDSSGVCTIPWEVLEQEQSILNAERTLITVTLVGTKSGQRITTNDLKVALNNSGYTEGENSKEPTPSAYEQYVSRVEATAATTAQNAADVAEAEERIKNSYANTLKGNASGEVVRVDDVSPVEHTAKVGVHGKNLVNINAMLNDVLVYNQDGTYTMTKISGDNRMAELVPCYIQKGTTITISGNIISDTCTDDKAYFPTQMYGVDNKAYYPSFLKSGNVIYGTYIVPVDITSCRFYLQNVESDGASIVFSNLQIEVGDTATEYEPYIDPSAVKLSRYGKNLFPSFEEQTANGVTLKKVNDYYVLNGTATVSGLFSKVGMLQSGRYTLSANNPTHNGVENAIVQVYSPTIQELCIAYDNRINSTVTADITGATDYQFRIRYENGVTYNNYVIKPQLELGDVATDYEAYNGDSYTPDEKGNVDVTSVSPTMTLFTDTDGVTIDLEYNRDLNANMGDIEKALDSILAIQDALIGGDS